MDCKHADDSSKSTIPGGAPPLSTKPVGARLPTALPRVRCLWSLPTGLADNGSVVGSGYMFPKQQQENNISVTA